MSDEMKLGRAACGVMLLNQYCTRTSGSSGHSNDCSYGPLGRAVGSLAFGLNDRV